MNFEEVVFLFCMDEDALVEANNCDIEMCKKRYSSLWRNNWTKVSKLYNKLKQINMEKVKIPANHLRAGNFHVGKDFSIPRLGIFSVKIDENSFHAITSYGISLVETGLVDFNPIPITENWLKKLGFEKRGADGKYRNKEDIAFEFKDNILSYDVAKCKYVHELQNLYFALYHNELELVKENA